MASSYREPVKVIGDIIKSELSLSDDQILLQYEKNFIPTGSQLYVSLVCLSVVTIANNNYFETDPELIEIQEVLSQNQIQIDALSFGSEARTRKEEILAALKSIKSQQLQEQHRVSIGRIPSSFVNTSSLEETKILNRYTITINIHGLYRKVKELTEYYDQFNQPEVKIND